MTDAGPAASRFLGATTHGYFFGNVFVPRAWTVDKAKAGRLEPYLRWTFVYSRVLIVAVPLVALMLSFILSGRVGKKCTCVRG